ncbi:hypothetical protein F4819DRAFT_475678 [Hypoxylon fuscum]|nr:hypothetical protein F4819DRAFT_475678 [Hypoxylon fuscum]
MSTPFICRQCIARLTQSHLRQIQPKHYRLHTQAASTSVPLPTWSFSEGQKLEPQVKYDITVDQGNELPAFDLVNNSPQSQDESVVEQDVQWDGHVEKYVSWPRLEAKRAAEGPPVKGSRDMKAKMLQALGDYHLFHDDLIRIYGLTNEETRHAIGQLERLVRGRASVAAVARRLDLYHYWKNQVKTTLGEDYNSLHTAEDDSKPNTFTKQDLGTLKVTWYRLDQKKRDYLWPQMILSLFTSTPTMLPSFIQVTFQPGWCPSYIVEDAVYLLFRTLGGVEPDQTKRQQLVDLVFFLLKNCPPRYLALEQKIIWKVMSWLPTPRALELYEALKKVEHPLHPNTLLHFTSRFARGSKYKVQAAEVVHSLSSMPKFDINSPAAASVCTTLLTIEEGKLPPDHAAPDELFKLLLDIGFRPNLLSLSALMRNFCIRGRVEIAWSIFNLLIQRGIEPDAHVFSILLNGTKQALDFESLRRIVNMTEASEGWSPYLLNDLLDFIYRYNETHNNVEMVPGRYNRKKNSSRALRLMVQVYAKFFDLAPLQRLFFFPLENFLAPGSKLEERQPTYFGQISQIATTLRPLPDALLMQPDSITLGLMFKAHLRTIDGPKYVRNYYQHFMKLLYKRDWVAVKLVEDQGTMVHDTFLRDFMQFKATYQNGIRMVENMHANARRREKDRSIIIPHPSPSVHTYTILMNGLSNHQHPRGVITALNMMIKEGITPNIVTWNIVIGTLLQNDYLAEAVRVMRHLEQIGLESNDRTVQEVTRLSKFRRKQVASLLKKMRKLPPDLKDQRLFAESLLGIWDSNGQKISEVSMKEARQINRGYEAPEKLSVAEPSPGTTDHVLGDESSGHG